MANNLSGISYTNNFSNLDGLSIVQADEIFIDGVPINTDSFIPYNGATADVNLGTFNFQTLGQVTAKKLALAAFESTIMTSPTTSSIFTADSWGISNTVEISSLGGGSFLSTSYLTINDITNHSTLLTFQSDGIANFANTSVRVSTMATNEYDVVNLSTLTSAVAFIENVNALNYLPYTNALQNLDMGGSTITTTGLMNAGALRITSSVVNADYTLSVNTLDQLEFTNLSNGSIFKTNGSDLFVTGDITCGALGATDVAASGSFYLAKASPAEWRTMLGGSDEYEIQDDAGVMRLRLSKTAGLTISTMTITQVPSATPTLALGVDGSGGVVSFAVPTATNILPLNNTFTGINRFNNSVLLNTGTAQGSLTVYNSTDSLPGGGSGSALAIFAPISTDSAIIFGCSANTTFAIRSSGSLSNPTLAIYSPVIPGMLTFTQNEATMTHGGNSFSLGNTRFLTSTVNSGVTSANVIAVSPTTISSSGGTYTALANSTTIEWRMRILADWIGGVNYTLTMVNTNWSGVKVPILITVQSPAGTTIGSATPTIGGTSQVLFTYPQGANGNIYIYVYYTPLGPTPTFTWTTLSVVANVLRSNLYSTGTALALNTTTPSFAGFALQSITAPNGSGNETTIENFIVGDVSAGTRFPKGYSIGFNAGNTAATIVCQQTSSGAGTTFYEINSHASYHSWKSRPNNTNSVDMVLNYNGGNGGLRLNKNGAGRTSTALLDVAGDTLSNGFILEGGGSFVPGCILSDANWGMLFRAKIAGAAGAFSFHNSAGTEKLRMTDAGVMSHTAGDSSYMAYGPNATWSSYLVVGATPDRAGAGIAQVITTNGNLHLDAGNSNEIYYGYYANARGTPNVHRWYGGGYYFEGLAYNTYIYAHSVVLEGAILRRSQCLMRRVYQVDYISWGPGINMAYAFFKYSQVCPVRISGKYSGYCTFVGMPTMTMRIYSQNSGAYRYYSFPTYQNITYAQTTYPIDIILDHTLLPETGWFDIYIYNSYGMSTDINNQLWVNVQLLPVNSF